MSQDLSDSQLKDLWRQGKIPVIFKRNKPLPVLARIPFAEGNMEWLPDAYADLDWTAKYFIHRLNRAAPSSGIRRERPALGDAAPVEQPPASD